MSNSNITDERAARRFHHIATLERQLAIIVGDIANGRQHMKELREQHDGLVMRIRSAARDEGELPLFNMDD